MTYAGSRYAGASYSGGGSAGGGGGGPTPTGGGAAVLWFIRMLWGRNTRLAPPALVPAPTVTQMVVCAQTVSAGATTIKVNVLNASIPPGTILSWSGGTQATVTALAPAYASAVSVSALSAGVAEGETASASVNIAHLRRVSPTMPSPTLTNGRPT